MQPRCYHTLAKPQSWSRFLAESGAAGKARALQINLCLHCSHGQDLVTMLLSLTSLEDPLCFFSGAFCGLQDFPVGPDFLSTPDSPIPDSCHPLVHSFGSSPTESCLWLLHGRCSVQPPAFAYTSLSAWTAPSSVPQWLWFIHLLSCSPKGSTSTKYFPAPFQRLPQSGDKCSHLCPLSPGQH